MGIFDASKIICMSEREDSMLLKLLTDLGKKLEALGQFEFYGSMGNSIVLKQGRFYLKNKNETLPVEALKDLDLVLAFFLVMQFVMDLFLLDERKIGELIDDAHPSEHLMSMIEGVPNDD